MINRKTVWNDTCCRDNVYVDGSAICVLTAIHHYTSDQTSRLDLVSELSMRQKVGACSITAEFTLTADQMELLADHLTFGAGRVRRLQAMLAEDAAEIDEAAEHALRESKEAA